MPELKFELTQEVKREIGQHFVFGFHGYAMSDDIRTLIRDYHIGNIILMKRNVQDFWQTRRLTHDLQTFAKSCGHERPLLIGIDQENGLVSAFSAPNAGTQFPGAMATAATESPSLAEEIAGATAKELKLAGINWVFSPVADVNCDPRNPVIGVRSYGDDPLKVAEYVIATSRGFSAHGVAPSAKHFPGHGDTHVDSHLGLPRILKTRKDLDEVELVPFRALIGDQPREHSVATIMTGHMAMPLITGSEMPCSLSREITTHLLREELGYTDGVIVTDCLEMDAIADAKHGGCGSEEGALRSLEAGADLSMICHTFARQKGAVERTHGALEGGRLQWSELVASGKRIAKIKQLFAGTWEDVISAAESTSVERNWRDLKQRNEVLSKKAYGLSTAVIGEKASILPFGKRILLYIPERYNLNAAVDGGEEAIKNTAGPSFLALADGIRDRGGFDVEIIIYDKGLQGNDNALLERGESVGIVFVTRNGYEAKWQLARLEKVAEEADMKKVPVVAVASCGPYDMMGTRGKICWVCSFEHTSKGLEAVVDILLGEKDGQGVVPVKKCD